MLQIVASLSNDSSGVIYNHNIFILKSASETILSLY
jgi:hypothetical protein